MHRWTAKFLMLVVLVPIFGPIAMAQCAQPGASHCTRQPMAAQPAMPCHHAMAQSKPSQPETSESFQASNDGNCCHDHCCCGATTSEWAHPASNHLCFVSLLIEPALPLIITARVSAFFAGPDSARAPPRS